jgi:hypothetical protein
MISPHTPPGTEIVCIEDRPGRFGPVPLKKGDIYTLAKIEMGLDKPCAFLQEVPAPDGWHPAHGKVIVGFDLERFRPLDIPPCLSALLQTKRSPISEQV